jgi:Ohr subfamily peroxiredoxin
MQDHRTPPINPLYTAVVPVERARQGRFRVAGDTLQLSLAFPRELGGDGEGTNPEQLFAAAYGACFANTIDLEARSRKHALTTKVSLGHSYDGGFGLAIVLHVRLPELDPVEAERLARKALDDCTYSKAVRGNVRVDLVIER